MRRTLAVCLPLGWRNLWRNPRRTGIILGALVVGMWSIVLLASLLNAWSQGMLRDAVRTLSGHGQIHAKGWLDEPTLDRLMPPPTGALRTRLDAPDVAGWTSRIRAPAVVMAERGSQPVRLIGIDPARERGMSFLPDAVQRGSYFSAPDAGGVVIGQALAERLDVEVGRRIVLLARDAEDQIAERGFTVTGVYAGPRRAVERRYVFVTKPSAREMLGVEDRVSEVAFVLHKSERLPAVLADLRERAPDLDVAGWRELKPLTNALITMNRFFSDLWVAIMAVLIAFGLLTTLLMAVFERTAEFGLLRALGMRSGAVVVQVLIETALLVGLGVALGLGAGAATVAALQGGIDFSFMAQGAAFLGVNTVLYPKLNAAGMLGIAVVIWIVGVAASIYPAWRAAHKTPVDALTRA